MFKFNEYNIIKENFNQLKSIVKSHGSSKDIIDNGYGTPDGIQQGNDDYQLLSVLISPDETYKSETKNQLYGEIPVNIEKEKAMRPFLGMMAKMYYEEKCDLSVIKFITDWIVANKQHLNRLVIKNNKTNETFTLSNLLDIFKYKTSFNDGRPAYEILTDAIRDKGGVDNVKNWINRLPSILKNGFKDETNYNTLSTLVKTFETISKEGQNTILTSLFGSNEKTGKVSRFKSAEEFLKALKVDIKNFQSDYNIDIIREEILKTKAAKLIICDYENGYIVADIWNYAASNKLGEPNNWCISYGANYWYDTYMNYDSGNKMFFIWNFNVDISNEYSHLGLCIKGYEGEKRGVRAFHDKFDSSIDIDVLDELGINKDFIYTQNITEEEYNFKEKDYKKYNTLKDPFNRWIKEDEAKKKCEEIIDLYNSGDIDDETMLDIWKSVLKINDDSILNYVMKNILTKCNLQPVQIKNSILIDYLEKVFDINGDTSNNDINIIKKFFELYSINIEDLNTIILSYLKEHTPNIYNTYFTKIKNAMKNYSENSDSISTSTIRNNIEKFIDEDYDLLIDYLIKTNSVDDYIMQIFDDKPSFIKDLITKDYNFNSSDIYDFLKTYDYDLTQIKISDEELDKFIKKCSSAKPVFANIENVAALFKSHNKEFYVAQDDVNLIEFFIDNNISLDKLQWHLNVTGNSSRYSSEKAKYFLENNDEKINIYQEFKKGKIDIEDKSFYYDYIIDYIFKNELEIEHTEMFLDSLLNRRRLEDTPIRYVKDIIELMLKYNRKIHSEIAKLALDNNLYDSNIVIDNLNYTQEYSYSDEGSEEIIKDLLSSDSAYADKIISKLPNLEKYDMDEVGIYVKTVRIINKLLDICKKPNDRILYYVLKYAYKEDNKDGDVGDNEETIALVNRLVGMKYKFDFESSYYDFYFIFENCGLMLLKNFIEKKYFNLAKLNIEKVCRGILKQDNIELYNYFKSILPKNSFKLQYLSANPNKEIVNDILTWDGDNFIKIFGEITNSDDYIAYYDRFYPKMTEDDKERIVNSLLSNWSSRELKGKLDVLNHLMKYDENKQFVAWNWDENKRRKNYSDEVRAWVKNVMNPPKVRVKKIAEMFELKFRKKA